MSDDPSTPAVWPTVRAALAAFSRPFPAEALALADAHREEVAPALVDELRLLAEDPARVDQEDMLQIYAMYLLAWWRDARGLQPLLALACLNDPDLQGALFGDSLAPGLGRCLGSMARGHLQPLLALASDEQACQSARVAALDGLRACVLEGDASRETVLHLLRDLAGREAARGRADPGDGEFLNHVVGLAADLCDADMLPAIRGWFDEGLLDPVLADFHSLELDALLLPEQGLQQQRERGMGYVRSPEAEMGWWYCFSEKAAVDEQRSANPVAAPPAQPHVRDHGKVGRNDPCPCGSGKKYKKCHGAG